MPVSNLNFLKPARRPGGRGLPAGRKHGDRISYCDRQWEIPPVTFILILVTFSVLKDGAYECLYRI